MSGDTAPFCLTRNVVNIRGGWLLHRDWVPAVTFVHGKEFITLHKADRKLSRAMGLDMTARDPWSSRSILNQLVSTRDDRIDELIKKKLCEQDEMSNASVATIPKSQRCKCYHAASIPDVITLEFPQFEMQNGQQHQSVAIDVLSTHIKGSSVAIELTIENLNFLIVAAHSPTLKSAKRKATDCELVPLTQPDVKWRRRGRLAPVIMCMYRHESGSWRSHSEEPANVHDPDAMQTSVRECEFRCQQFYNKNHVEEEHKEGEYEEKEHEDEHDNKENMHLFNGGE